MQEHRTNKQIVILLAEDDPGDQDLTRRALDNDEYHIDLRIVEDGEEALDYLHQRGQYGAPGTAPRPDLILLDLNMPKMNGREVLQHLEKQESLARIPLVVLTTSEQEADILKSYALGCNSFIRKPVEFEKLMQIISKLVSYWFDIVTLPPVDVR